MKKLASIFFAGLLFLSGCKRYELEHSRIKKENAIVTERYYIPESCTIFPTDGGCIPVFDGPSYNIYFNGEIDFLINDKEIFNRFNIRDSANITYREYKSRGYNFFGPFETKSGDFYWYEFIDAKKK